MPVERNDLDAIDIIAKDRVAAFQQLANLNAWPNRFKFDAAAWLKNFSDPSDLTLAIQLLDGFLFFDTSAYHKLVMSALESIYPSLPPESAQTPLETWSLFLRGASFTFPTGNATPKPSESGQQIMRVLRSQMSGEETSQFYPQQMVSNIASGTSVFSAIFVDDFLGSGDQLIETVSRKYDTDAGFPMSLLQCLEQRPGSQIFVVAALGTRKAIARIESESPDMRVFVSHEIDTAVNGPGAHLSSIKPESLGLVDEFLIRSCLRAGIDPSIRYGHNDLGLSIGFGHGVPDSTLPIFTHVSPTWSPLVKGLS